MEIFKLFGTILIKDDKALKTLNNLDSKANTASSKLSKAFKKIGQAVITYFAIDKIRQFGQACVEAAADVEAETSAFNATLGKNADAMTRKLKELGDKTGITYTRMTEASTLYYNKWTQAGYDSEKAMKMTTQSIELGADAAAYYNMSLDNANGNIKSFINGNFEAGDAIGVSTNATSIAAWATKELGVDYNKASESQKQAIRQDYLQYMYDVSGVTGQASRESGAYENQVGNLKEAWRQFKATIGDPLLNSVVLPAIKGLTDFINNEATPAIQIIKDKVGEAKDKWGEFKEKLEEAKTWIDNNKTSIELLAIAFGTLAVAILAYNASAIVAAASSAAETLAIYGLIAAETIATGATTLLTTATSALGVVIGFLTSPITLTIAAIGLLVAAGVLLYKNWDTVKAKATEIWNNVKNAITKGVTQAKDNVVKEWNMIKTTTTNIFNAVKNFVLGVWNGIKTNVSNAVEGAKSTASNAWNSISSITSSVFNSIKSITSSVWNGIKSAISSVVTGIKISVSTSFKAVKSTATNTWNGIKTAIMTPVNAAKSGVQKAVNAMKGFFNFSWKLPSIKLPHFSVSGSKNPIDWLSQGVPKISVSWYKKGAIMDGATIFGMSGNTLLGGGEAGPEAILPLSGFYNYMDKKLDSIKNTSGIQVTNNIYSPDPLTPSEIARQTKNSFRKLALEL